MIVDGSSRSSTFIIMECSLIATQILLENKAAKNTQLTGDRKISTFFSERAIATWMESVSFMELDSTISLLTVHSAIVFVESNRSSINMTPYHSHLISMQSMVFKKNS